MPRAGGCKLIAQKEALVLFWRVSFGGISSHFARLHSRHGLRLDRDCPTEPLRAVAGCRPVVWRSRLEFAAFSVKSMFMISGGSGIDRSGRTGCRLAALGFARLLTRCVVCPGGRRTGG